jgi:RNA polymerase sigma-70 factor (sigma-E family)
MGAGDLRHPAGGCFVEWLKEKKAQREFEAFAADAFDSLYRSGFLMTGDVAETEDLLQETLLQVARRWNRVRSMERPVAYARRILVNLIIDGAQARTRRTGELGKDDGPEVLDEAAVRVLTGIDDRAEFVWALGTLTHRQRAVLTLRYFDDLSENEVAEVLGCPVGTVKSSASRAIDALREALGRSGERAGSAPVRQGREGEH